MSADASGLHLKSGLVLLAVFLAGAVTGGGVLTWLAPRPLGPPMHHRGPPPPGGMPRWMSELSLRPEQEQQARAIFEKYRPELERIFQESMPKAREVNEKMEQELRALLDDAQRARLDELRKQRPPMGPPGMGPPPPGMGPPPMGDGPPPPPPP